MIYLRVAQYYLEKNLEARERELEREAEIEDKSPKAKAKSKMSKVTISGFLCQITQNYIMKIITRE